MFLLCSFFACPVINNNKRGFTRNWWSTGQLCSLLYVLRVGVAHTTNISAVSTGSMMKMRETRRYVCLRFPCIYSVYTSSRVYAPQVRIRARPTSPVYLNAFTRDPSSASVSLLPFCSPFFPLFFYFFLARVTLKQRSKRRPVRNTAKKRAEGGHPWNSPLCFAWNVSLTLCATSKMIISTILIFIITRELNQHASLFEVVGIIIETNLYNYHCYEYNLNLWQLLKCLNHQSWTSLILHWFSKINKTCPSFCVSG